MPITMPADEWLSVLRKEYLQDFIPSGGAAVKFVVPMDGLEHKGLLHKLKQSAEADGYLFVSLDAATTKLHMIDQVFHAIAKQVAWDDLAYTFLQTTLSDRGARLPVSRNDFSLLQLASLNGYDMAQARGFINDTLRERLFQDYDMAEEFRIAMLQLCRHQLGPGEVSPGMAEAIKEWLRGELRLIRQLKYAPLFQKISRHNGRYMLFSLSHWLHLTGKAGLVIVLDISRFLVAKRPPEPDGTLYYRTPAVIDAYEVLRQCIDGTDELKYCLIVLVAPPSFLTDERRGLRGYEALYFRIWDEVHDRQRANPLSSLLRLSGQEATGNLPGSGGPP